MPRTSLGGLTMHVRASKIRDYRWCIGRCPARVPPDGAPRARRRNTKVPTTTFAIAVISGAGWADLEAISNPVKRRRGEFNPVKRRRGDFQSPAAPQRRWCHITPLAPPPPMERDPSSIPAQDTRFHIYGTGIGIDVVGLPWTHSAIPRPRALWTRAPRAA